MSPMKGQIRLEGLLFRFDGLFLAGVFLVPVLIVGRLGTGNLLIP